MKECIPKKICILSYKDKKHDFDLHRTVVIDADNEKSIENNKRALKARGNDIKEEILDNEVMKDIKILDIEFKMNSYRFYMVSFLDKYWIYLSNDQFMETLFCEGIEAGGKLPGEYIFVKEPYKGLALTRVGSEKYFKAFSKTLVKKGNEISTSNMVPGKIYSDSNNEKALFLGCFYNRKAYYHYNIGHDFVLSIYNIDEITNGYNKYDPYTPYRKVYLYTKDLNLSKKDFFESLEKQLNDFIENPVLSNSCNIFKNIEIKTTNKYNSESDEDGNFFLDSDGIVYIWKMIDNGINTLNIKNEEAKKYCLATGPKDPKCFWERYIFLPSIKWYCFTPWRSLEVVCPKK